jgi:hypothetical protein
MAKAQSLKTTPFVSLGGDYTFNDVFTKDYIHKKLGNFGFKAPTLKNGNVNVKLGLNLNETGDQRLFSLSDEFKVGFPFSPRNNLNLYLESRFRRNGEVKVHLDGGNLEIGKDVNVFANVKTNMSLDSLTSRVGVNYFGASCESGTRFERTNKEEYFITQRNLIKHGYFLYAFVGSVGLDDFKPVKYDGLLKYTHNSFDLYVQHFSPVKVPKAGGLSLGKVALNAVLNYDNKNTFGAHLKYDHARKKNRIVLGAVHKLKEHVTLKGKVDNKLKLTGSGKVKVNDKLTVTLGGQLNLQHGSQAFNFKKLIPIPLGFNLDFAI